MPVDRVAVREWRDERAATRFPFSDEAGLVSRTGLAVDPGAFVDGVLYPVGATGRVHLAAVVVAPRAVTLEFGDAGGAVVAAGTFDPVDPPAAVALADPAGRPAGVLVGAADRLAAFQTYPAGRHPFSRDQGEVAAGALVPVPGSPVRGVVLDDGEVLTGDVWLVGEDGVVLTRTAASTLRVDVVGDPLFRRRLCGEVGLFETPRILRTVNGAGPDAAGAFTVWNGDDTADGVLRVTPTPTGFKVGVAGRAVAGGAA